MKARFADSYIDKLFAERNLMSIDQLISVREQERTLPEEFKLFSAIYVWIGSTRSGVWQYYEGMPEELFRQLADAMDRHGLTEIAEKYRLGQRIWNEPDAATELDDWIDDHSRQIVNAAFDLILPLKDQLKNDNQLK